MTGRQADTVAELQRANAELRRERDAALSEKAALTEALAQRNSDYSERTDQQAATTDVLKAMSASPGDAQPVFDLIVARARDLSDAYGATLTEFDGTLVHHRASTGISDDPKDFAAVVASFPKRPTRDYAAGRAILDRQIIRIDDQESKSGLDPIYRLIMAKSLVTIPLLRGDMAIGALTMGSRERGGFSDSQIELFKTFAEQAVIAITSAETYRALQTRTSDLQQSLEYQTATSEVLKVISGSEFDLAPVFQAIVETAARLCRADQATIYRYHDREYQWAAGTSLSPDYERIERGVRHRPGTDSLVGRVTLEGRTVQISDAWTDPLYELKDAAQVGGVRTMLGVPLLRDGEPIGVIGLARRQVEPFTDRQIDLVSTFADQAVIAIENTRLITEQREALEQQTAMAEVLQVINASPGDLGPVFDIIGEKAIKLCDASFGGLMLTDGERFRAVALGGVPEAYAEFCRTSPDYGRSSSLVAQLQGGAEVVHTRDLVDTESYAANRPATRALVELGGGRTLLGAALRKDGKLFGAITIYRQKVRPFSDRQIALLQQFAAQAVIAMENARLLTEQQEALEQQTATAEVLQAINSSPGDLAPVFDAVLDKAMRLCGAAFGSLYTYDGESFLTAAQRGVPPAYAAFRALHPPTRAKGGGIAALVETRKPVHVLNLATHEHYRAGQPGVRAMVDLGGVRTSLIVPLLKDDALIGCISIYRQEVRAFSDKQIALLEGFSAQAVIAMENARLLTETREALEQQTATAEVLQVINASPGNLAPVFDTILEKALQLCGAAFGGLSTFDGERRTIVARTPAYEAYMTGEGETSVIPPLMLRVIETKRPVQIADRRDGEGFSAGASVRTLLHVPLLKDEIVLGCITVYRQEVRLYSDKEIALLQNFAAQAVIAMENARLLNEQREALEQQTATAEVLQVINSSPGDLQPVFEAILEKAHSICGAALGSLTTFDGEFFRAVAIHGFPEQHVNIVRRPFRPNSDHQKLIQGDRLIHLPDVRALEIASDDEVKQSTAERTDVRTLLAVPLRKDGILLGFISACRLEVRPFSAREIALLENFAAQAVIAMENARLLDEIRQRQEELRITFENMGDGVAMFDETQRLVAWNGKFQEIFGLPAVLLEQHRTYEEHLQFLAARGDFGAGVDTAEQIHELVASTGQPYGYERTRPDGKVIEIRRNPVPDGGFVLIFSDITERKRSEAEIRAARDAAEGASRAIEAAYRDLKAAQANLIQAEKMASLGQLTAGIAHEIKNPLNFVNNFSRLSTELIDELRDVLAPEPLGKIARTEVDDLTALLKGNLEKVVQHGQRADGIVRSMLDHSRGSSGERRMVDLNALIDEALNLAYHGARAQDQSFNITLERDLGAGIAPIEVNPQDITRVFLNIFSNGFYAAARRARNGGDAGFVPTLTVTTRDAGEVVEIRVRDNGTGIPADIKDKLFQPFFTTKPTGEGTGLGLSITYDIVTQQHGGDIAVDSKVGEYSEFTIRLPRDP